MSSVVLTYPYTASTGSFIPPPISPPPAIPQRNGYQYVIPSATNPNLKYLVTCSLPQPYPCSFIAPIQQILLPQPQIPVTATNAVYGR
ncbi:hypothetical protein Ocin01_07386 [Orchesella cincta]|uniref:Uncharacterized protein n=1 Tax=Orchesella cincta TaxID=48709 RepID=A0A1D2N1X3_ORCCI|nr:hypothetical protein Ocin01_07386 [Orchesella cincta]